MWGMAGGTPAHDTVAANTVAAAVVLDEHCERAFDAPA